MSSRLNYQHNSKQMYGSILSPMFMAGGGFGFLATKQMRLYEKDPAAEVAKVAALTIPVTMLRIYGGNIARKTLAEPLALLYAFPGSFIASGYAMALGRQTAIMSAVFYQYYNNHLNSQRPTMV